MKKGDFKVKLSKIDLESLYTSKSSQKIAKELNVHPSTIIKWLRHYDIPVKSRGFCIKDLFGERFGMLKVLEQTSERKRGSVKWKCLCDCGEIVNVSSRPLITGNRVSCGCIEKFKGCGDVSGRYVNSIKKRYKSKGMECDITAEFLWDLFLIQDRRCALSRLPINLCRNYHVGAQQTASVDRIDSTKGYLKTNVQWLHKDVNRMKQEFDQDYFINLCKCIIDYYVQ